MGALCVVLSVTPCYGRKRGPQHWLCWRSRPVGGDMGLLAISVHGNDSSESQAVPARALPAGLVVLRSLLGPQQQHRAVDAGPRTQRTPAAGS